MAKIKKPTNPKFPAKPKSDSLDALARWEEKCAVIRKAYDEKMKAYNDYTNKKESILNRVKSVRDLNKKKSVKKRSTTPRAKKGKGKKGKKR